MHRLPVLLILAASLACSSGGGGGDDAPELDGIGGVGVTQGPITGFGSRVVGGTAWTIPGATIVIDGETNGFLEADLLRGMVVTIEGERSEDATAATATRVEYDDAIEGPILDVQTLDSGRTLRLLMLGAGGPSVLVRRDETLFVDTSFDDLSTFDVVEVSGFVDDAEIEATLIVDRGDMVVGVTPVELKGVVANHTVDATFTLGVVQVFYDATTDTSGVPGGIEEGQYVEVKGILIGTPGVGTDARSCDLTDVCEIALVEDPLPDDVENVDLVGYVTARSSQKIFEVNGRRIDASRAGVRWDPGESDFIAVGARVAVEGDLVDGELMAVAVRNRSADRRIEASVASTSDVSVAAGTIRLDGETVRVDASTVMIDERGPDEDFDIGDIVAGDDLVVIGTQLNSSVRATHLTRRAP
jgi:hypothetical protein